MQNQNLLHEEGGRDASTHRGLTERSGEVFLLDILSHRMSEMAIFRQLRHLLRRPEGNRGIAVFACFPPKVHDGPDCLASDLFCKQQVARRGKGPRRCTLLDRVSILLLFQVP